MRTRKQIEEDKEFDNGYAGSIIKEVLLDIRDLLLEKRGKKK